MTMEEYGFCPRVLRLPIHSSHQFPSAVAPSCHPPVVCRALALAGVQGTSALCGMDGAMPNRAATQHHQGRHDWSVHAASWQAGWPLATAQPPPPKEPRHRAGASVQELLSTSSRHSLSASHPAHPRSATPSCRLDLKYLASDTSPSTSRLPEPDTFPSAQHPSAPSAASLARRTKLTHRVKHHQNGGVLVAQGP